MGKMKVTKRVFEAFEKERVKHESEEEFNEQMLKKIYLFNTIDAALGQYNEYYLSKCVILGYELEEAPEENILKAFNEHVLTYGLDDAEYCRGWKKGLMFALDNYGIKIKGIN